MDIEIKPPGAFAIAELRLFETFILQGSEIGSDALMGKIKDAYRLIFIRQDGACVAVGALRHASIPYCNEIFGKAGVAHLRENYLYEVSWFYVTESARGRWLGHRLMRSALKSADGSNCFATAREDNRAMHAIFKRFGFRRLGRAYPSMRGDYSLCLFDKTQESYNPK